MSGLEKRRLLSTASWWGGEVEREVPVSSPWCLVTGHLRMVQSCSKGDSDVTLGNTSMQREWPGAGAGFLGRWLVPQACWGLGDVWTMPLLELLFSPEMVSQLY